VHHVADGKRREALAAYYGGLSQPELAEIETVEMDMSCTFIAASQESVPEADRKISIGKFHVAMHLGQAVDRLRRDENPALRQQGENTLSRTRRGCLFQPDGLPEKHQDRFDELVAKTLRTSRAWDLKELAMEMWESRDRQTAIEIFEGWYSWAIRSRLETIKSVARTMKRDLTGILNAFASGAMNAQLDGINTVIQNIKRSARGFRNRRRFITAIYFHLGGLQLYPAGAGHSGS
jgi:transposase